jgi:hypothetical protein
MGELFKVSALHLFYRVPYAAPILLPLRFVLRQLVKHSKKNPQKLLNGAVNLPCFPKGAASIPRFA